MRRLSDVTKFQKALALYARAATPHEAEAAELAVRRLVVGLKLDPICIPNQSFVSDINLADNALLQKLRDEWRAAHPDYYYKTYKDGHVRRLRRKPRPVNTKPVDINMYDGLFDDFSPGP